MAGGSRDADAVVNTPTVAAMRACRLSTFTRGSSMGEEEDDDEGSASSRGDAHAATDRRHRSRAAASGVAAVTGARAIELIWCAICGACHVRSRRHRWPAGPPG